VIKRRLIQAFAVTFFGKKNITSHGIFL